MRCVLIAFYCSATGVIRRHPDIKWLRKEADIEQLVTLQGQILDALWHYLKPNGVLLYATCSVLAEENSQQIERFLQNTPDAQLVALDLPPDVLERNQSAVGFQFIPQIDGGDGFYYAKLVKRQG